MNAKGILTLNLVLNPVKKSFTSDVGKKVDYWELTLSDGGDSLMIVTGDADYDFSALEVGKAYCFGIVPRVKSINAVAKNGNTYSKKYNEFKIVKVFEKVDVEKFKELIVMK